MKESVKNDSVNANVVLLNLILSLLTGQNGHLVAAGTILEQDLVASGDGGVVKESIEGVNIFLADQANA